MNYHDLTICIPAYNESSTIGKTLEALWKTFPRAEIIVVDDGSEDQTGEIAQKVPGTQVLFHKRNIGYGAALKTAMREASRGVIAWLDCDDQHSPEDLARVVRPVLAGEKDAVIGVRGTDSDICRGHAPGKWVLNSLAEIVTRESIPDLNSGMRCFRRELIQRYQHLLPDGFSASATSTLLMMKRGYRLGYEKISTKKRVGTSKVKILRDGWRTIHLLIRILILFDAFSFFSIFAALQTSIGFIYGVVKTYMHKQGFPVFASVVVISGILTFFMGLICDQIVAMRIERFEYPTLSHKDRRE
jgi:glycosyltransferase involved in cell wall biosynthesis